jgi:hypothetical protein
VFRTRKKIRGIFIWEKMRDSADRKFHSAFKRGETSLAAAALRQQGTMVSRKARDAKADAVHVAAMKIIEAENAQRRLKTARLRALRLARQAEIGPPDTQAAKADRRGSIGRAGG